MHNVFNVLDGQFISETTIDDSERELHLCAKKCARPMALRRSVFNCKSYIPSKSLEDDRE